MANPRVAKIVLEFNTHAKQLGLDLIRRFPNDPKVAAIHRRVKIATETLPDFVIQVAGEQLAVYVDTIFSDDPREWARFFEDETVFEEQISSAETPENEEAARYLVPKIQALAKEESMDVKREYIEKIRAMIDLYESWLEHNL